MAAPANKTIADLNGNWMLVSLVSFSFSLHLFRAHHSFFEPARVCVCGVARPFWNPWYCLRSSRSLGGGSLSWPAGTNCRKARNEGSLDLAPRFAVSCGKMFLELEAETAD